MFNNDQVRNLQARVKVLEKELGTKQNKLYNSIRDSSGIFWYADYLYVGEGFNNSEKNEVTIDKVIRLILEHLELEVVKDNTIKLQKIKKVKKSK